MELRQLRYFIALAEDLHFGRAAERLQIAQPALSQQIRRLEDDIGVQLLQRTKRRVRLTEAGAAFLQNARLAVMNASDAIAAARDASRGHVGTLAIGFVTSALYGVFPDIVRLYRQRYPDVHLRMYELPIVQQLEWMRSERLQVSFLRPPIEDATLTSRTIVREPWVAALPESHPHAARPKVALRALAGDPFIVFPRELAPQLHDQLLAAYLKAGFHPRIALEAQMHTIVSLVAANVGVALVPASLQNLKRAGVVYKPVAGSLPKSELAVVWRKDGLSPVLQAFLDVVREVGKTRSGDRTDINAARAHTAPE